MLQNHDMMPPDMLNLAACPYLKSYGQDRFWTDQIALLVAISWAFFHGVLHDVYCPSVSIQMRIIKLARFC